MEDPLPLIPDQQEQTTRSKCMEYYYKHINDPGFREKYNTSRVNYYNNNVMLERERSRIRYYAKLGRPVPARKV